MSKRNNKIDQMNPGLFCIRDLYSILVLSYKVYLIVAGSFGHPFFRNQRLLSIIKDQWTKVKTLLKMARASHKLVEVVVLGELPGFQNKQLNISLIWGVPTRDVKNVNQYV